MEPSLPCLHSIATSKFVRVTMQFKIEPFKHPVKMDPSYGGEKSFGAACASQWAPPFALCVFLENCAFPAEKTWKVLEDAIHEINNHNASGLSFEELYRFPS